MLQTGSLCRGWCLYITLAKLLRVKWTSTLAAQIRLILRATRESAGKLTEPLLWVSPALLGNAPLPVSPASSRLYSPPSPAPESNTAACPELTFVLTHCRSLQPDHHLQRVNEKSRTKAEKKHGSFTLHFRFLSPTHNWRIGPLNSLSHQRKKKQG